jgi:two-component system response regulator
MTSPRHVDILLVEDNPSDAELCVRAFRRNNLANAIDVVTDGAEALEYLTQTGRYSSLSGGPRPKVVLLDLKLPKVGGLEVLERVKADPATAEIPVVILTSSREDPDIARAYALGVNSYIVKPVDFDGFSEAVRGLGFYWLLLNEAPRPRVGVVRETLEALDPLGTHREERAPSSS